MNAADQELVGRALARWLAPYIADELSALPRHAAGESRLSPAYDEATCAEFVTSLGDVVLKNGEVLFGRLASAGEITSLDLADALDVASPRQIPAILTTPLKKRARALRLPSPWKEGEREGRTVWLDHDGIAARMLAAIQSEGLKRTEKEAA